MAVLGATLVQVILVVLTSSAMRGNPSAMTSLRYSSLSRKPDTPEDRVAQTKLAMRDNSLVMMSSAMTSLGNPLENPSAVTSPEKPGSRAAAVTVQWAVDEERPAGSVIGDLRQSLAEFVDAERLAATSFQTLPRPNQDLEAVEVDRKTGVVKATDSRLDRESRCPATGRHNASVDCTMDISIGLVHSLQLEQVYE